MTDWIIPHRTTTAPTRRSKVIFGRRTRRANEAFKSTGDFAWPRTRDQFRISGELRPSLNFCRTLYPARSPSAILASCRGPSNAGTSRNDFTNPGLLPCRGVYAAPGGDLPLYEGVAEAGSLSNGGTLSPRQLAASLSPRKTALRREQRQRHSSFLFRFRLLRLFSFPIGSSLTFRHNFFLSISFRK